MQNTIELPKNWQWTTLGEIASLERGKFSPRPRNDPRYFNGKYPWIQTGEVESANKYIRTYQDTLNEFGLSVSRLFPKGTLVITIAATIGAVGILDFDTCMPDSLVGITPKKGVGDTEFLYYLLLFLRQRIRASATQSAQANINLELLRPIKIPLPPIAEQKRIAAIAQKADRLRRTRRYTLELSDSYLRSVFLEMFGDPVANPKGWESYTLDQVSKKITDGEHLNPVFQRIGYPIVMAQQVEDDGVNLSDCCYVSEADFLKFTKKCKPQLQDILLVSRGATIGRSCVVDVDKGFCLMGSVILIKPNDNFINSQFLSYLLKTSSYQKILKTTSGSSAQQAIYIANLREKPVITPPLPLQEKFAQIVQRFERLRIQQREADRQAEHLFQTILHRAFRGEL